MKIYRESHYKVLIVDALCLFVDINIRPMKVDKTHGPLNTLTEKVAIGNSLTSRDFIVPVGYLPAPSSCATITLSLVCEFCQYIVNRNKNKSVINSDSRRFIKIFYPLNFILISLSSLIKYFDRMLMYTNVHL